MQPVFIGAVADGRVVLGRCQFAVAAACGLGIPVAFTEQVPAKLGSTDPSLLSLVEKPEVHPKDTFSAFSPAGPVREALARGRTLEHVLICGVETPICVYQSAADALQAGLSVTILSDCVGARRREDAATCTVALARAGAHVLPSETVFYSILGGTAHPYFKAYTQLVKKYA
jgi:nicotinamidase-related amidase